MRWSRLWVLLGCLLLWGSGTTFPTGEQRTAATASDQRAQGVSTDHARVAAIDDTESAGGALVVERLRLQHDAHAAPHWEQRVHSPRDWRHERVALHIARRATAPPLVGIVELLI